MDYKDLNQKQKEIIDNLLMKKILKDVYDAWMEDSELSEEEKADITIAYLKCKPMFGAVDDENVMYKLENAESRFDID